MEDTFSRENKPLRVVNPVPVVDVRYAIRGLALFFNMIMHTKYHVDKVKCIIQMIDRAHHYNLKLQTIQTLFKIASYLDLVMSRKT
jgi:hypothetical protein